MSADIPRRQGTLDEPLWIDVGRSRRPCRFVGVELDDGRLCYCWRDLEYYRVYRTRRLTRLVPLYP